MNFFSKEDIICPILKLCKEVILLKTVSSQDCMIFTVSEREKDSFFHYFETRLNFWLIPYWESLGPT